MPVQEQAPGCSGIEKSPCGFVSAGWQHFENRLRKPGVLPEPGIDAMSSQPIAKYLPSIEG